MSLKVIAIAAVAKNGVIGKGLELPWVIPEDMKFFRDATREHIVIMGRKTYDALGRPLPKRANAVVTRDTNWSRDGVSAFSTLESAIGYFQKAAELNSTGYANKIIFVIGGAEIYKLSLPMVDEVWLTEIDTPLEGDIFFPDYQNGRFSRPEFKQTEARPKTDRENSFNYSFIKYGRSGQK
jgi:dihydrofolate reductase